jgi:dTDP-4-dehydrorhamnose reductase
LGLALAEAVPDGIHLNRDALDITNADAVSEAVEAHRPEVIINAAAYTAVDQAESEPQAAFSVNSAAVENLAKAADAVDALLVQLSTDYVFGGDKKGAYLEDDDPSPMSVYGKSKLEGEQAAAGASRHLIVRTSWLFGNGKNFIRSILKAAESRDRIDVVDDQEGLPTYARDLADGLLALIETGATSVYHLAGGGAPGTWADVAEIALQAAGNESEVRRITSADYHAGRSGPVAPRPRNSVLGCSKAAEAGVKLRPWREAVVAYVKKETA